MRELISTLVTAAVLGLVSVHSYAEYVVIVNPANTATISKSDLENLFLAKTKAFSDGTLAIPLNQDEGSSIRSAFDNGVVGKTEAQMKSYWAKLVFTGKAVPIKQMSSDQEVMELVAKNTSTVGYIDSSSVDDSVKVLLSF